MPALSIDSSNGKRICKKHKRIKKAFRAAVHSSRAGRPEVVLKCLEITVQCRELEIHNLLVNPILIMKAANH